MALFNHPLTRLIAAIAIVVAILYAGFHIPGIRNTTLTYTLLLAILFFAVKWDRREAVVASLVAAMGFQVYFQPPIGQLHANDPESYIAVLAFLATALVVSQTSLQARRRTAEALAAKGELEQKHRQLEEEKAECDRLLLNILPADVARELRTKGIMSPRYFEDVTILFTDFVGFTTSTEKLAAEELVELLHDYFTAFDEIVQRYGLEKLKTIGDSYMCASGLPARNPAHPVDAVMVALEMIEVVERRAARPGGAQWKVRIGIHTGPVVAGVVGVNKFAFDIWGETVNHSSRMESAGAASRINLSERTYMRAKDFIECEARGRVMTKEKREVDMYFANRVLPSLLDAEGEGAPPAFVKRYNKYFQKDPPSFPARDVTLV